MKKRFIAVCLAAAACILLSTTIHTAMLQREMSQKVLRFQQRQSGRSGVEICRPRPCGNHDGGKIAKC